jgi:cysteine synthase
MIVKNITDLIGNTPLLEIDNSIHGLKNINLYAKLELFNPFGSVKDKTAWAMLREHIDEIKNSNDLRHQRNSIQDCHQPCARA